MTLYEIGNEYAELRAALMDTETDDDADRIASLLEIKRDEIKSKTDAYAKVRVNLKAQADAVKAEIDRLDKIYKRINKNIERLDESVFNAFSLADITEMQTTIGKWRVRPTPLSVTILDESKIPDRFMVPQPSKPDKRAILAEFKETGEIFEGCDISSHLKIGFR